MTLTRDKRGFTLVELIVVMAIFLIVIFITTSAFETIVTRASQQSKSAETQIQGVVGLELLRADLERAGFGLPWTFSILVSYEEPTSLNGSLATATLFNDAPNNAPRAIISADSTFNGGSKYLVIKSTLVDANDATKKWTTVSFDTAGKTRKIWGTTERDFATSDRVTVVKNSLVTTPPTRELMASASNVFSTTFQYYSTLTIPHQNGDVFQVYGVNSTTNLRMPFNRVDYYVDRPDTIPKSCAPTTGILYRSTISQADAEPSPGVGLLDCVADLQVVYGLDTSGAGFVNSHTATPPATAEQMRSQLKEVRVYILAQEGKKDRMFSFPTSTINVGEIFDGSSTVVGRSFNLTTIPEYQRYRWKVYTIVVRPKNLIQ